MIFNLAIYELIDRYLKGTLSEDEKALFEKQQIENPDLAEEVKFQSLLNNLVVEKGLVDIRNKVGEDLSKPSGASWFKTILLSSGALLMVTGGILYFTSKGNLQPIAENRTGSQYKEQSAGSFVDKIHTVNKDPKENVRQVEIDQSNAAPKETKVPLSTELQEVNTLENAKKTPADPLGEEKIEIIESVSPQVPCSDIIFEVKSEPSCYQKQTGKIQILISSIKGGSKPYLYSIAGNDFGLESVNGVLGEGNYLVQVKDDKGCISGKQIQITEKACTEFADYSFNPAAETWKFPLKEHESGSITIADKSGRIVYSSKIIYGISDSWDGRSLNGDMLESGSYLYIIESKDVKIKQGYITIIY